MRKHGGAQVFTITGARQGLADDVRGRQRRYVISMSVRTASVIAAAVLWNVERHVAVVALVLGVVLPYVAVVVANAGRETAPKPPSTFVAGPRWRARSWRRRRSGPAPGPRRRGRPPANGPGTREAGGVEPFAGRGRAARYRGPGKLKQSPSQCGVPVRPTGPCVTYCVGAPPPPSERRTDAGQLPRGCPASPCPYAVVGTWL